MISKSEKVWLRRADRNEDRFGPERCVWGSDFPCELWAPKINYTDHLRIFTHDLPLKESARTQILGLTAQKLWFSKEAGHTQA